MSRVLALQASHTVEHGRGVNRAGFVRGLEILENLELGSFQIKALKSLNLDGPPAAEKLGCLHAVYNVWQAPIPVIGCYGCSSHSNRSTGANV